MERCEQRHAFYCLGKPADCEAGLHSEILFGPSAASISCTIARPGLYVSLANPSHRSLRIPGETLVSGAPVLARRIHVLLPRFTSTCDSGLIPLGAGFRMRGPAALGLRSWPLKALPTCSFGAWTSMISPQLFLTKLLPSPRDRCFVAQPPDEVHLLPALQEAMSWLGRQDSETASSRSLFIVVSDETFLCSSVPTFLL
jgi:hypothetical protein